MVKVFRCASVVAGIIALSLAAASAQERLVVLPGTVQGALGGGNWAPADKITQMTPKGNGIYEFSADFPKGSYEYKVALDGSWAENYGLGGQRDGPNIPLSIPSNGFRVRFVFDYATKLVKDSVTGGISAWSEPESVKLLGLGAAANAMKKVGEGQYALTVRLAKGSYAYRVQYNDRDDSIFGKGGTKGGEALSLVLAADADVSFNHLVSSGVSWDSVNYVTVPPSSVPTVRIDGFPNLVLSDPDYDNLWTGSLVIPPGKKAYDCRLFRGAAASGDLKLDFNEVAPGFAVSFTLDTRTGAFSSDYQAALSGPDGKVLAKSLYFDSRDSFYKAPFGAVPAGTEVRFTFSAKAGDLTAAKLVVRKQKILGNQDSVTYAPTSYDRDMVRSGLSADGSREYWTAKVKFDGGPAVYGFSFLAIDGPGTVLYGNNDQVIPVPHNRVAGTGGVGMTWEASDTKALPYRLTVYDPAFKTPDWAKDAVYYYIFPDRFRNGDKTNDPVPGKTLGYKGGPVEFHDNWLDPKPLVPGKSGDGIWCNDFYGGDLAGVTQELDYIKGLGANVIYINPIFMASSNHKYDTSDFKKVDPSFGSLKDFDTLVAEAKKRGMRIILDTSLNHSGSDSVYMDRWGRFPGLGAFESETIRKLSPYYSWYKFNPGAKNPDQAYDQWGDPSLATLQEVPSYLDFALTSKDSVVKYWLKRGTGGWRMDVTPWKSDSFWGTFRKAVKSTNPDALTVAETWFDASKYFLGDTFDSTMNYIFRQAVLDFASGGSGADASSALEMMRENYPPQAFDVLMNLLSSHDVARSLYLLGDKGEGESVSADQEAKQRYLLAVFLQMSYPGAPAIYYGDEVGMTGGEDPYNRGPYPWADLGGKPDTGMLEQFKALTKLRSDNPVLRHGSVQVLQADGHLIVMLRRLGDTTAIVAVNNATFSQTASIDASALAGIVGPLIDSLSGESVKVEGGKVSITLPALAGRAFIGK